MHTKMDEESAGKKVGGKVHNILPIWGNEASMNLNPLILANIQGSSYFKVHLFKLKTYHEVVDEIYYQVKHMEPWERGSRKTSGQTGMCGGVRGVGAGGIVSTAYCLLYKLYTLRLTRKQVNGLLNHGDSPYIRALGFMYLRYTQPPGDLYSWYEDYLVDDEEIDVKAGGGQVMSIGQMVYQFLTKLDWFSTLFPRIPVPIQKQIEKKLEQYCHEQGVTLHQLSSGRAAGGPGSGGGGAMTSGGGVGGNSGGGISGGGSGFAVAGGMDYDYDSNYDRRGSGGGGASCSRGDFHSSRSIPSNSNYRTEHDDRDGRYASNSSYQRRRDEHSPSPAAQRDRERQRDKHKRKKKHKHHSRSRSRERSRSRSPHQRHRGEREHDRKYEHKSSRDQNRDDYVERRHR